MKKMLTAAAIAVMMFAMMSESASAITLPKPPVSTKTIVPGCPAGYTRVSVPSTDGLYHYKCVKN